MFKGINSPSKNSKDSKDALLYPPLFKKGRTNIAHVLFKLDESTKC